jgi:hypothetical protein
LRRALFVVAALAALAQTGCIALPWAAPPVVVGAGAGVRATDKTRTDVPYELRAGVSPFGISPDWVKRRGDLQLGYVYEGGATQRFHAVYIEGGVVAASRPAGDGVLRVIPHGAVRGIYDPRYDRFGRGAVVGVTAELATPANGPFSSSGRGGGMVGVALGEGGIGFYAEAAGFDLAERFTPKSAVKLKPWQTPANELQAEGVLGFTLTGGLVARVPATAGVV